MKFVFKISLVSITFFTFLSCSSSEPIDEVITQDQLTVSSLNTFSANQESQSLKITANLHWF